MKNKFAVVSILLTIVVIIESIFLFRPKEKIELIIALKPTIEGETTLQYINKLLKNKNVEISRLSYGIPVGTEIDYLDALTLERAFEDRRNL